MKYLSGLPVSELWDGGWHRGRCRSKSYKDTVIPAALKTNDRVQWGHGELKMVAASLSFLPVRCSVYLPFPKVGVGLWPVVTNRMWQEWVCDFWGLVLLDLQLSLLAPGTCLLRTQSPCCEETRAATERPTWSRPKAHRGQQWLSSSVHSLPSDEAGTFHLRQSCPVNLQTCEKQYISVKTLNIRVACGTGIGNQNRPL